MCGIIVVCMVGMFCNMCAIIVVCMVGMFCKHVPTCVVLLLYVWLECFVNMLQHVWYYCCMYGWNVL